MKFLVSTGQFNGALNQITKRPKLLLILNKACNIIPDVPGLLSDDVCHPLRAFQPLQQFVHIFLLVYLVRHAIAISSWLTACFCVFFYSSALDVNADYQLRREKCHS